MRSPIVISPAVIVPPAAWSWRATRSSGPGGQNVNKVASRVELRVDLHGIVGLRDDALARLRAAVGRRVDSAGRWLVVSQTTRDQGRNLEEAMGKVRRLVAAALVAPRPRRPTKAGRASVERRLAAKKLSGARKKDRRPVGHED